MNLRPALFLLPFLASACLPFWGDKSEEAASPLTESHPGWKDPCCGGCHDEDDHNAGLSPQDCAACHGGNGAPSGHDRGDCASCHGQPHTCSGASFPSPDACLACHPA
jgi:hypothetical protein